MTTPDFGWHYPPGAENDPRAPWNQDDDYGDCDCGQPATANGLCRACNRAEALLERAERRRDE